MSAKSSRSEKVSRLLAGSGQAAEDTTHRGATVSALSPAEQAAHPDTPPQVLLELAEEYPDEVLANPTAPLLALEDPELWRELLYRVSGARLKRALEDADIEIQRRFALGCAERVLPAFERLSEDDRPRKSLQSARAFLRGLVSQEELLTVAYSPHNAAAALISSLGQGGESGRLAALAHEAARSAGYASRCCAREEDTALMAFCAAFTAADASRPSHAAEREWQLARLQELRERSALEKG
jgi:hypothetical protein